MSEHITKRHNAALLMLLKKSQYLLAKIIVKKLLGVPILFVFVNTGLAQALQVKSEKFGLGGRDYRIPIQWITASDKAKGFIHGPGDYGRRIQAGGQERFYEIHVPKGYSLKRPTSVVLVFHGGGGYPSAVRYQSGMDEVSNRQGFLVVYPAGTGKLFNDRLLTWNDGRSFKDGSSKEADDVGFVAVLLDDLGQIFDIDQSRIYATGISNGAQFCYRLAKELSNRIAAIAPIAGHRTSDQIFPAPPRPLSIMQFSGLKDSIAHYHGGSSQPRFNQFETTYQPVRKVIQSWVSHNGCLPETTETQRIGKAFMTRYGPCEDDTEVVLWTLEDGGHTWPGGRMTRSEERFNLGHINKDIVASEVMWEFFKKHSLAKVVVASLPPEPKAHCGNDICEEGENAINCKKDCGLNSPPYYPEKYKAMVYYDPILKKELTRTYLIYVPSSYRKGVPMPLVLNFHGGGGTGEAAEISIGGMNRKADEAGFLAVYPNGLSAVNESGRRQVWYAGSTLNLSFIKEADDVGFIRALLEKLKQEYSIDLKRVYATGISNGAWMTYALACQLSDRIAAIAPVAGGMVFENCQPKVPVPIIHFHGTADPGWPYYGGGSCWTDSVRPPITETISQWVERNACDPTPKITYEKGEVSCNTYTPCSQGTEITFCTIRDGGHTYPGGYTFPIERVVRWDEDCALGQKGRGVGKVSYDIFALDVMWEFFKHHPKRKGLR